LKQSDKIKEPVQKDLSREKSPSDEIKTHGGLCLDFNTELIPPTWTSVHASSQIST